MSNTIKASELVERALHLADITNTDFLTYKEKVDYINDAWKAFYQSVINKGDKAFVKTIIIGGQGTYILPKDFYQMCSLRTFPGHSIINRASESSSSTSSTYEIINDKLIINGNAGSQLELTYWTTPTYISLPNKPISFDDATNINDTLKDDILLNDGTLKNYKTGDVYGSISLSPELSVKCAGNGIVLVYLLDGDTLTYQWQDVLKNTTIAEGTIDDVAFINDFYIDADGNRWLTYQHTDSDTKQALLFNRTISSVEHIMDWKHGYIYSDGEKLHVMVDDKDVVIPDTITDIKWAPEFNGLPSFYINNEARITFNDDGSINENDIIPPSGLITAITYYGPASIDYIYSAIPDTEMNFPNNLFFELFSFELAVAFARKQNIDYSGLQQAYQDAQMRWMNTLSQDSEYPRIINVYN